MTRNVSLSNFQEPIAFPKNKKEPSESRKVEPVFLDGVVNQSHSVFISHPVPLFLIEVVLSSKFPDVL